MNVSMKNISFSFGENEILNNVNFSVNGGEIRALLGENGAGKSTLMNLLGGILHLTEGEILLDGKSVYFSSPSSSLNAGIGFIHQELNLINELTVYENMFISNFPRKGPFLLKKEMIRKTREIFDELNIDINPLSKVRELDVSYKQIIEISRALMQNAKVIIMDEPTSSLTDTEINRVFKIMRSLREKGVAIIFISHKLNEVMDICDTYTVIRNGLVVKEGKIADTSIKELSEHLVGHSLANKTSNISKEIGNEVLRLEHLSDETNFFDVNLNANAGEILGITGLLGDGRSELFRAVFGAEKSNVLSGKIYYNGAEFNPKNTSHATNSGIAFLLRDRAETGIIKDMSVMDNGTIVKMPKLLNGILLNNKEIKKGFQVQKKDLSIKMNDEDESITTLSGGNQQKVLLCKWLMMNPKLLILDNPTQGVDIGAKEDIYEIIRKTASNGTAIIVLSPEAQEIISLCKRAFVMFHGKIAKELKGDELNEHNIMFYATGGTQQSNAKTQVGGNQ